MSWSESEKRWAQEILRGYYGGMGNQLVSAQDIDTLVFGDVELRLMLRARSSHGCRTV